MKNTLKVVLTGGGTAGHVTPALEIGRRLKENYNADLHYIGNQKYIEYQIVTQEGIPFYHAFSKGMEGSGIVDKVFNFAKANLKGISQAVSILRSLKPDFIVSTGGFVTAPVLTAARLLNIPFYMHEQNTVMGRVNKLFAKKAKRVFLSFEDTKGFSSNAQSKVVGNPVGLNSKIEPGNKLLVLGGSGGSAFLNDWALNFSEKYPEIPMVLVTGKSDYDRVVQKSAEMRESNLELFDFADMNDLYQQARVVVSRGGTSSLFELANAELPTIAVPLPNSMDNHQYFNALHFSNTNSMLCVEQQEQYSDSKLDSLTLDLWQDDFKRNFLSDKLASLDYKNCANSIAATIYQDFLYKLSK